MTQTHWRRWYDQESPNTGGYAADVFGMAITLAINLSSSLNGRYITRQKYLRFCVSL